MASVAAVPWAACGAPKVWWEVKVVWTLDWANQELAVGHAHLMCCHSFLGSEARGEALSSLCWEWGAELDSLYNLNLD